MVQREGCIAAGPLQEVGMIESSFCDNGSDHLMPAPFLPVDAFAAAPWR
jgi:hypothetical protein